MKITKALKLVLGSVLLASCTNSNETGETASANESSAPQDFYQALVQVSAKKNGLKKRHGTDINEWPVHCQLQQYPL